MSCDGPYVDGLLVQPFNALFRPAAVQWLLDVPLITAVHALTQKRYNIPMDQLFNGLLGAGSSIHPFNPAINTHKCLTISLGAPAQSAHEQDAVMQRTIGDGSFEREILVPENIHPAVPKPEYVSHDEAK